MAYSFPGDRPPESGELKGRGQSLPAHQRPVAPMCRVLNGVLRCYCGTCVDPAERPERFEDLPAKTPGWTVEQRSV